MKVPAGVLDRDSVAHLRGFCEGDYRVAALRWFLRALGMLLQFQSLKVRSDVSQNKMLGRLALYMCVCGREIRLVTLFEGGGR